MTDDAISPIWGETADSAWARVDQGGPVIKAALWFAERGFGIFPLVGTKGRGCACKLGKDCASPGKHPATANGFKAATSDPAAIRTFLSNPGTPNYGLVAPEGVIIIDVDDDLTEWNRHLDELPPTLTIESGKGEHVFLDWPTKPAPLHLFEKLVRSHDKGYVVGPGSVHVNGKTYRRKPGTPGGIAEAPWAWIPLADYGRKARTKPSPKSPAAAQVPVPPGQPPRESHRVTVEAPLEGYTLPDRVASGGRYDEIRDYVAHLYNYGLPKDEILGMVLASLAPLFDPPLSDDEIADRFARTWDGIVERLGPPSAGKRPEEPAIEIDDEARSLIIAIKEYAAMVPSQIPWVAEPYVYYGGVTLVSGPPKRGKSTLISEFVRGRLNGVPFLSVPVAPGPVLYLTEEGGIAVIRKFRDLDTMAILDRATAVRNGITKLKDVLALTEDWVRAQDGPAVVIIDTLAIWAGLEDENNASEVTKAIGLIMVLAGSTGAAIILVHHTRKGGGADGEAIRGSSAMLATPDTSIEMRGVRDDDDGTRRDLDLMGRLIMPQTKHLDFVPISDSGTAVTVDPVNGGYHYVVIDAEADSERVWEAWTLGAPQTRDTARGAAWWGQHWDMTPVAAKNRLTGKTGRHGDWFASEPESRRPGERQAQVHWWVVPRGPKPVGRVEEEQGES